MAEDFADLELLLDALLELESSARPDALRCLLTERPELDRPALLARLQKLLAADARASQVDAIAGQVQAQAQSLFDRARCEEVPELRQVGDWQLGSELGRGGMGVVYLAERRQAGFRQLGALKLIKRGMDSEAVNERFARERRLLARLEHPHIARLIDGGTGSDGRAYLVMEYVDGDLLLAHVAARKLRLAARLGLFLDVCKAVAAAHQQLIVHRDLKPGNVMVDVQGTVKLLDFGIAKVLDGDICEPLTATTLKPQTPLYASPEQRRGESALVTSDIYSLGLLLYELITGERAFADIEAARSGQPLRPSAVTALDPLIDRKALRGDIDVIVQKALAPEPARRYPMVAALAEDVERHLRGEPIRARRDSTGYVLGKFVTRHRLSVGVGAAALLALIVSALIAMQQADTARSEAARARSVTRFVTELFVSGDPIANVGRAPNVIELLDRAESRLQRGEFDDRPELKALLLAQLGETRRGQARMEESLRALKQSVALYESLPAADRYELARTYLELARTLYNAGQEQAVEAAVARGLAVIPDDAEAEVIHLMLLSQRCSNFWNNNRLDDCERCLSNAIARAERTVGDRESVLGRLYITRGRLLEKRGRPDLALAELQRGVAILSKTLGEAHVVTLEQQAYLAANMLANGQTEPAIVLLKRSRHTLIEHFGPTSQAILTTGLLGSALRQIGDLKGALAMLDWAIDEHVRITGQSVLSFEYRVEKARVLAALQRQPEAIELLESLITLAPNIRIPSANQGAELRLIAARALCDIQPKHC